MISGLLLLNMFVWLAPPFFLKDIVRGYFFLFSMVFSGSYWISILFYSTKSLPGNVLTSWVPENLYYSVLAGISFYAAVFLLYDRKSLVNFSLFSGVGSIVISNFQLLYKPIGYICFANLIFIFICSLSDIGIGDRIYFLDTVQPFWFVYLLPLNSVLLFLWILLDTKCIVTRTIKSDLPLWITIFAHVILVGFDGSRRQALIPIFAVAFKVVVYNINKFNAVFSLNKKSLLLVLLLLVANLMTLNRAYDVGWGVLWLSYSEYMELIPIYFELLLSPSPTIHVNTQMLELVSIEGVHGYSNYLCAFGNFIFPYFIFGSYFFGDPLVLELHDRFNWYGQDFGFMAEAIYSGGLWGVVALHFFYGAFVAFCVNGWFSRSNSIYYYIISFFLLFGAINSLRSDFMNLLKASFYPAVALSLLFYISSLFFKSYTKK